MRKASQELVSAIIALREEGRSNRDIRNIIGCSAATVSKYCQLVPNNEDIKLLPKNKQKVADDVVRQTRKINLEKQVSKGRSYSSYYNLQRRTAIKQVMKKHCGVCVVCGYTGIAMCSHHVNPADKKFIISGTKLFSMPFIAIAEELAKCASVCANCHVELHGGALPNVPLSPNKVEVQTLVSEFEDALRRLLLDKPEGLLDCKGIRAVNCAPEAGG